MITSTCEVKKIETLETGWLGPSGEFIYCATYDHMLVAEDIVARHPEYEYRDPQYAWMNRLSEDDLIIDNGWVHITQVTMRNMKPVWHIMWSMYRRLTSMQRKVLEPYFLSGNVDSLSYTRWKEECD